MRTLYFHGHEVFVITRPKGNWQRIIVFALTRVPII